MQLMVNTLNKAQQQQSAAGGDLNTSAQRRTSTLPPSVADGGMSEQTSKVCSMSMCKSRIPRNPVHHVINFFHYLFYFTYVSPRVG